jgi:hypothetical protein
VLYPSALRDVRTLSALRRALEAATLEIRVVSEGDNGAWSDANIGTVVEIVGRGRELLARADVVAQAVADLEGALDGAAAVIGAGRGTAERLADLLGIPEEAPQGAEDD